MSARVMVDFPDDAAYVAAGAVVKRLDSREEGTLTEEKYELGDSAVDRPTGRDFGRQMTEVL
jgi:hypothetical protein